MKKRIISAVALLLALIMTVALAACSDGGKPEATTTVAATDPVSPDETQSGDTEFDPDAHVPAQDLDRYVFKVLTPYRDWATVNLTQDSITGDTIQDTICERQHRVEERLKCRIEETNMTSDITTRLLSISAASGDDAYDLALVQTYNALNMYMQGYVADQAKIASIDLNNPWWEQSFNSKVNLKDKRYITFGNASLIYYSSFYIFCFNKQMITNYGLDNPYDLVESGDWTWENAYKMMQAVGTDVGQDGVCNPGTDDILGLTGHINHSRNLIFSSGFTICQEDANGNLTFDALSGNYIDAFTKFTEYFITSPYVAIAGANDGRYSGYTGASGLKNYISVFVEGKSLFLTTGTHEVISIRESTTEYGITVVPKYSKDQDYITPVYSATEGFVIPTACGDTERAGAFLEALGAYSYNNLVDKHIMIVLHYRVAHDPTAIDMINLAYRSGAIDVAMANNFGSCVDLLLNLNKEGMTTVSTLFGAAKAKMKNDLAKAMSVGD